MIVFVAPDDKKMYERTLKYAKENNIRMLVVDKSLLFEEVLPGSHSGLIGEHETIWIVGHGNTKEIGDETSKGVTLTAGNIASFVISILHVEKYQGSIVLDTCNSGVMCTDRKTLADVVYEGLLEQYPKITVGGWIESVSGPISQGKVELTGEVFSQEAGFVWAKRKKPINQDHKVLALLA